MPFLSRIFSRHACGRYAVIALVMASLPSRAASLSALLPPSGSVMGWKSVGQPKVYDRSTLYELVDGEAEAIEAYAFNSLIDGRYSPDGGGRYSLDVNLYDMSNSLNAYGLFSQDRLGAQPLWVGAQACQTSDGTGLSFWKGQYLVRIASTTSQDQFRNGIVTFAKAIAARLPGTTDTPAQVKVLPAGMKEDTIQFKRENVAGQAFVTNAVTARYPDAGPSAELFIANYSSSHEAGAAYQKYVNHERARRNFNPIGGLGDEAFSVIDPFALKVVVAHKSHYLIGMVRSNDESASEKLVRQAAMKLH